MTLTMEAVCAPKGSLSDSYSTIVKGINALDSTEVKPVEIEIPEGKDLRVALWAYSHDDVATGDRILKCDISLPVCDVINNVYQLKQQLYYKAGKSGRTISWQEVIVDFKVEDNKAYAQTKVYRTCSVNNKLQRQTDWIDHKNKDKNSFSEAIGKTMTNLLNELNDDYEMWNEKSLYNLEVQNFVGLAASNKLKAKKWYAVHPLEGKEIEVTFIIANIDESKKTSYSYEIGGVYGIENTVLTKVYTNDDKYIDMNENEMITVKGIVKKVRFSDSDFSTEYRISSIEIEETE